MHPSMLREDHKCDINFTNGWNSERKIRNDFTYKHNQIP